MNNEMKFEMKCHYEKVAVYRRWRLKEARVLHL